MSLSFVQGLTKSFVMTVLSEIGDKTFFAAAILAMRHPRRFILSGCLSALTVMTVLSVVVGWAAPNLISRRWAHYITTALFFIFGLLSLWDGFSSQGREAGEFSEVEAKLDEDWKANTKLKEGKDSEEWKKIQQPFLAKIFSPIFLKLKMAEAGQVEAFGTRTQHISETQTEVASAPTPPSDVQQPVEREGATPIAAATRTTNPSEDPSQVEPYAQGNKRKPSRPASSAWNHFKKDGDKAICNYCGKQYSCNSSNHGTTNLNKHLKVCVKNPSREVDKKQKIIVLGKQSEGDSVTMKLMEYSQEKSRTELAKMLVTDELPFKFVENAGFKGFMNATQPRFKIPSRRTIARDCMQLFIEEKVKLKSILSYNHEMVSLTTDTWTSIQNMNYMCVTAHFIDDGWVLHKKILSFGLISDHKGETIGKYLEKCLKDWGIVKVGCITVDNAGSNNTALTYLIRNMSHWNGSTILKGQYMHFRCCAHILNLIVCDGMKEIDVSIGRIRASCKYVRSSPSRLASFKRCALEANIITNQMLVLDVPTRWNSTYLMLAAAEKFERAFNRLEYEDGLFINALNTEGGPPNPHDWERVRKFIEFLKIFYDTTLMFSSSLQVTANTFFHQLCLILTKLTEWMKGGDIGMLKMATNMISKLDKYWDVDGTLNYLLFVAVFLDPRYKLAYIEFCLRKLYDSNKCNEILNKLNSIIKNLFDQYVALHPLTPDSADTTGLTSSHVVSQSQNSETAAVSMFKDEFRLQVKRIQGDQRRNELERYMEDDIEDDYSGFDILRWWKGKTAKYYVLSWMARDILAIPVSTVSSEAAFSTGGRVLDPFRSSLNPMTVEALICTQNWLRPSKMGDESHTMVDEMDEVETDMSAVIGLEEVEVDSVFENLP